MRWARAVLALVAGAALAIPLNAHKSAQAQQDYPNKPITLILPLGAGGAMDILARGQFAPKLSERLGKPVVVENRTGGGTVIAATAVAKSPPDGYTLFFVPAGTLTTNATVYKKPALRSGQGFRADRAHLEAGFRAGGASVAAGEFGDGPRQATPRSGPASCPTARPASARRRISRSRCCSARPASTMTHVPYRGMPQATNDVVAGHTQHGVHRSCAARRR